jgi:hypothetical protein
VSAPNVLIACEYSATERDAFRAAGFNAISCDLLPSDVPGPHYQGDVFDILNDPERFFGGPIDLMIAHPPCTYLTNAGARWLWEGGSKASGRRNEERWENMREGALFFKTLLEWDVPRIAVENPVMVGYAKDIIGAEPDFSFQPWDHGHLEQKQTCYWLKNLPPLEKSNDVKAEAMELPYGQRAKVHHASPGPDRWKIRSTSFSGVAQAMVDQWGPLIRND